MRGLRGRGLLIIGLLPVFMIGALAGTLVVASLPESKIETGDEAGKFALERLRNVLHRAVSVAAGDHGGVV